MTELRARANRVLLRQITEDEVSDHFPESMLVIPDSMKNRLTYRQYVIEDVGPDCDPELLLMEGLRVIIQPRAGTDFRHEGKDYKTVFDTQIVAVFG